MTTSAYSPIYDYGFAFLASCAFEPGVAGDIGAIEVFILYCIVYRTENAEDGAARQKEERKAKEEVFGYGEGGYEGGRAD